MNVHKNARLTPSGRVLLVQRIEQGWSVRCAAGSAGVSERTAHRWLGRYRAADEVASALFESYLADTPIGTWRDRFDLEGRPTTLTIPGSSLYHLCCRRMSATNSPSRAPTVVPD